MSRLNELVAELCPDGVEYKQLRGVVSLQRGVRVVKKDLTMQGLYPVYQNSLVPLGYHSKSNCSAGTTFIICAGAAGGVGYSNVDFWAADDCFYLEHSDSFDEKFAFYVLQSNQHKLDANVRRASIPRLPRWVLDELLVPVPPIEVQREVVRILDSFQELDDALSAEIEAREKQLDAMRASIYSDVTYPMAKLGDIGRFERGKRFTRSQMGGDGVPCIHYGDIYTKCKYWTNAPIDRLTDNAPATLRYASKGDVVIAATSENVEDVCTAIVWDCGERAAVHDDCQIYHHEQNPLYIALFFNSGPFVAQKMRFVTESKVVRISGAEMAQTTIPLPPVSVQNRIAQNMADSIYLMDCLRSEREARRKQFAYYRDKLLAFPELNKGVDK